ncbi:hypothetical protein BJ742DRAFT_851446 [Cladochytrium replicatum]|nr:hypothetical protein BJ742DRAFT_851446 [Cladochytrium replicatum]
MSPLEHIETVDLSRNAYWEVSNSLHHRYRFGSQFPSYTSSAYQLFLKLRWSPKVAGGYDKTEGALELRPPTPGRLSGAIWQGFKATSDDIVLFSIATVHFADSNLTTPFYALSTMYNGPKNIRFDGGRLELSPTTPLLDDQIWLRNDSTVARGYISPRLHLPPSSSPTRTQNNDVCGDFEVVGRAGETSSTTTKSAVFISTINQFIFMGFWFQDFSRVVRSTKSKYSNSRRRSSQYPRESALISC